MCVIISQIYSVQSGFTLLLISTYYWGLSQYFMHTIFFPISSYSYYDRIH